MSCLKVIELEKGLTGQQRNNGPQFQITDTAVMYPIEHPFTCITVSTYRRWHH